MIIIQKIVIMLVFLVIAGQGCTSAQSKKEGTTQDGSGVTENPQDTPATDGGTGAEPPPTVSDDSRDVIIADDQKNDDDDFVIAETSTYISGANLLGAQFSAKELGGKKRVIPVVFDPLDKTYGAKLPRDGYFVINVGEKAAVVPPSSGPLKLTFRRYHLQTEKLLTIALGEGIEDLLTQRILDIGTFSYLGQILYRSSRRYPDLFEKEKENISSMVKSLVAANRAQVQGGDAVSLALELEKNVAKYNASYLSAREEISANRALAAVFPDAAAAAPIKAALTDLGDSADQSVQLRSVADEVNYLAAMTKIQGIEKLPPQVVEDLSINTWRQVTEYPLPDVKEAVKTGTPSESVASLVEETNKAVGSASAVVDAVFSKRKWRVSESFQIPNLAVQGGRLIRADNEVLFTFFASPRGVPLNQSHPVVDLYTRSYKNGYWYPPKLIAKGLAIGNFGLDQYCVAQGCFIATFVGEEPLNPPVNGNQYGKYFLQMFALKTGGEIVKFPKMEMFQWGLMRTGTADKLDVAMLIDRSISVWTYSVDGTVTLKKNLPGDDYSNLYAINFENNSVLSVQRRQFVTTEAYPDGYWIWRNYFQIDDGALTEILTGLQFPYVTGLDLAYQTLSVSVVSATKQEADNHFRAKINVYDVKDPAKPVLMFNPMQTNVSHKTGTNPVGPGDFAACRLADNYWFLFGSVFNTPTNKNYLLGYSEKLPITAPISSTVLDNGTYARNAIIDCSYQQALYWVSETAESQAIKALNISESGKISEAESVVVRNPTDLRILQMTTLSDKSGFRAILGLQSENVFVNTSPVSSYDLSRTDLFMYLFE